MEESSTFFKATIGPPQPGASDNAGGRPANSTFHPIRCTHCGSYVSRKNGHRYNRSELAQTYECLNAKCGKGFTPLGPSKAANYGNLVRRYLTRFASLRGLVEESNPPIPKSTAYVRIREEASRAPSGVELSKKLEKHLNWGYVLGVDTGFFGKKETGTKRYYFHCADILSHDPIDYVVGNGDQESKDYEGTILERLNRIRYDLGYDPKIVVIDRERKLVEAVQKAFPHARVISCLFHLEHDLNKRLPTRRLENQILKEKRRPKSSDNQQVLYPLSDSREIHSNDEAKLVSYKAVKQKIAEVAMAENKNIRNRLLRDLSRLDIKNARVHFPIEQFKRDLDYYPTTEELAAMGLPSDSIRVIRYNNLCENHIGQLKELWNKHKGFKSPKAFQDFVNYYWYVKRTSKLTPTTLDFYQPSE